MIGPNFLIIGAAKSGTTSLYKYLQQHPQIFMSPNKEPKFFAFEGHDLKFKGNKKAINQINKSTVTSFPEYQKLFRESAKFKAIGEASPIYLHSPIAAERINNYFPDIKLIAILRNPIERLYSDWKHQLRMGFENKFIFMDALMAWDKRKNENWVPYLNYIQKGYYYKHISRYLSYFKKDQMLIILYEDFSSSPEKILTDILAFLNIDPYFSFDTSKKYMVGIPIIKGLLARRMIHMLRRLNSKIRNGILADMLKSICNKITIAENMSEDDFSYIRDIYHQDILLLQDFLNRDLSQWLVHK